MTLPTFAELAGDTEPRLIEASRLFRAVPAMRAQGTEGAKQALVSATDAAAREGALRWLEGLVSRGLAMAELVEGPRADTSDTAAWEREAAHLVLGHDLPAYLDGSPMARDPDWPAVGKVAMALCDPTMRGEATRLLRDMWWRAMLTEQIEARKKPGAFLASVGIIAEHVAQIAAEGAPTLGQIVGPAAAEAMTRPYYEEGASLPSPPGGLHTVTNDTAAPVTIDTEQGPLTLPAGASVGLPIPEGATLGEMARAAHDAGMEIELTLEPTSSGGHAAPPREHPPMPRRNGPQPPLPGAARRRPVDAKEIADAIQALGKASVAGAEGLHTSLGISSSTWNNWLAGRNVPRVDVHKARVLSAEIARVIAELERVDEVLRQVVQ